MSDPVAKTALREQEEATNRAKEEALRTYDTALRVHNHPDAGSQTGDHLTEAAYAAGHRIQETVHKVGDKISTALGTDKATAPVTTSETNQKP